MHRALKRKVLSRKGLSGAGAALALSLAAASAGAVAAASTPKSSMTRGKSIDTRMDTAAWAR